ncbi:MAG: nickel-dependent hydrogenase large subunit [Candidatus Omnitrophica bacterium]|nr:nickel-dependent hydrogenase large subunit [Candidatus Omnitrophota bacterium]MBU1038150.1 nickel-dependent hydrogenase large subunit [Candidatus Omnitrophota bacterium]MBU1808023.1 nickel-dependent hydrogenase large subunit [Candidatus Omnitrophota bacterium]
MSNNRSTIPIGPYHPLQEEPEFWKLIVEGEKVVDVDVRIGYNHRGIEKISESKSFDQSLFLVERICGICSSSHPIACAQAIEDITGTEVPERALYIRTISQELERLHSHMLWVGLAGHFLGYNTVFMWGWKYREPICDIMETVTGNRQNYAMHKVGGVRRDIEKEHIPYILTRLDEFLKHLDMLKGAVLDDPVLHARLKGVGVLTKEAALDYSALGPTARASDVNIDVRRDHPYGVYDRLKWNVITQKEGDVFAKAVVRILEMYESASIIRQCLDKMPDGPIDSKPKDISQGEGIGVIEAPRGECFHYIKCDGTNSPVRHKIRAPTYMNFPTFRETVIGETVSDATIIMAAIDPCYCCTERMTVVDHKDKELLKAQDLIRLSQEKTRKIKEELGAR